MEEKSTTQKIKTEENGAHFIYLFFLIFFSGKYTYFFSVKTNQLNEDWLLTY